MYGKEPKSISKSVRMTQSIFDFVSSFEGNGFNEKFENLVRFCFSERSRIESDISSLRNRYNVLQRMKISELDRLDKQIAQKTELCRSLELISSESSNLLASLQKLQQSDLLPF